MTEFTDAYNEGNPYKKIDNENGYDQSEAFGIVRQCVCGYCHESLILRHHPKTFTHSINCHDPDCPGDTYVSKYYLAHIEDNELTMGDEVSSNLDDFDEFMKKMEDL